MKRLFLKFRSYDSCWYLESHAENENTNTYHMRPGVASQKCLGETFLRADRIAV